MNETEDKTEAPAYGPPYPATQGDLDPELFKLIRKATSGQLFGEQGDIPRPAS